MIDFLQKQRRLEKLSEQYPELQRIIEISEHLLPVILSNDIELIEDSYIKLENILKEEDERFKIGKSEMKNIYIVNCLYG